MRVAVVDSHTGGEPTRLVLNGGPDLGNGSMVDRLARFRKYFDSFRSAVVNEPRGSDAIVGALLCDPPDSSCQTGVIFFNNVGYLGMCGHGTIGLVASLAHAGKIAAGRHRIDTPVGPVDATLNANGSVSVRNVPAYRHRRAVTVDVPGHGTLTGDVAWGGNWFFLAADHGRELEPARIAGLTAFTDAIRDALHAQGITGADGAYIDHIELFADSPVAGVDSRNFVLCPGSAYDRSPCGTGTSAKLACLAAEDALAPGEVWRQESIIGSVFEGSYAIDGDALVPTITGYAHIMGEGRLVFDERDPFKLGIA